ncbi:ROK family protein [bacterium]|nr:ROK family protein [bacterium]
MSVNVIALDVGGTSVKSAQVVDGVVCREIVHTPINSQADADVILGTLAAIVNGHLAEVGAVDGVALGFPGPFEYATGVSRILGVEKFESIYGCDVGVSLRERLDAPDLPIRFRNDAEAAIVGEARFGAGWGFHRLIGLTLGTGSGSAFLIGGVPQTGGPGVPPNGWIYPLLFEGHQADDVFSIRGLVGRCHAAGIAVDDVHAAADLAHTGNDVARQIFADFGRDLGIFMRPLTVDFQADGLVVLGGIANAFDLFGATLQEELPVAVCCGELGETAALLGAYDLFLGR